MIREVTAGDGLFDPALGPAAAYAHGVNCHGLMGAGIAVEFRDRYPRMYTEYRRRCNERLIRPGDVMHWVVPGQPVIYNLATQDEPGPAATSVAIYASVKRMALDATLRGIGEIRLPRIGCGIGGLKWENVRHQLDLATFTFGVALTVVTFPETY